MKNAKVLFVFTAVVFMLCSCTSTGNVSTDIADTISRNSRTAGQLEATVTALDGTIADSRRRIESIVSSSRTITDGIARLEYLFTEYEQETNRLLNEINAIRNEAEKARENN